MWRNHEGLGVQPSFVSRATTVHSVTVEELKLLDQNEFNISTLNFKNFLGQFPQNPSLGIDYSAPSTP